MELNIGANIKRWRLAKGLTQEQLAGLLGISTAAVSKWEAKNAYPDITLLFPLAEIFKVSVDELMGYDEEKAKAETEKLVARHWELYRSGQFAEASALLAEARRNYPHDYGVMNAYMWDIAGGNAGNNAELLLEHQEELTQICNCILDGCKDEEIRLEAMNMKAKLLHAQNDTKHALEILSQFPGWASCAEQKKEQLFAKESPEYRYWNRKNCYTSMQVMANKLARTVRFDDSLSMEEKIVQIEFMGDEFVELSRKNGLECLCVASHMIFAILAGALTADNSIEDVIRIREKQFEAMKAMVNLASTDEVLREQIESTYGTDDIIAWKVDQLMNSPHTQFARLREDSRYMAMLLKWQNQ